MVQFSKLNEEAKMIESVKKGGKLKPRMLDFAARFMIASWIPEGTDRKLEGIVLPHSHPKG